VTITVVPNGKGDCSLSIDGKEYPVALGKVGGEVLSISEVANPDHERVMRTCIDCQGRTYCITNGCANTPCGWICD
jgi:hypothetical protein